MVTWSSGTRAAAEGSDLASRIRPLPLRALMQVLHDLRNCYHEREIVRAELARRGVSDREADCVGQLVLFTRKGKPTMTTTLAKRKGPSLSKAAKDQQDLVHARQGEAGGNGHVHGTNRILPGSYDDAVAEETFNSQHGAGNGNGKTSHRLPSVGLGELARTARRATPIRLEESASQANAANGVAGEIELQIELRDLVRHEDNREPTAESVQARAESLKTHGQFEAVVVRDLGGKWERVASERGERRYQILSGETRYLAAKQLGWKTVRARVVQCTDAEALVRLAEHNGQRTDLTAIDKARLIQRLCAAEADGGAGLTREAAGKHVGYASGSAASNVVRLLELPKVWQDRVVSGELPETFARCLLRVAKAPTLLHKVEEDWKRAYHKNAREWDREGWESRDGVSQLVQAVIADESESLDPQKKRWSSKTGRAEAMAFKLTEETRAKLRIETVTDEKGREIEVATDAKAFEELQEAALAARVAKKGDREQKSASQANAANKGPKLSPAEKKRQTERKARADRERVERWRHNWLAELVADELLSATTPAYAIVKAALYLLTEMNYELSRQGVDLLELVRKAVGGRDVARGLNQRMQPADNADDSLNCGLTMLAQVVSPALKARHERYASVIETELIEGLIGDLSIDVDREWAQDAAARTAFYSLFTSGQLDEMAKGLKVHLVPGKPKSVKVSLLAAKTERPAALRGVGGGQRAAGSKKKGRKR